MNNCNIKSLSVLSLLFLVYPIMKPLNNTEDQVASPDYYSCDGGTLLLDKTPSSCLGPVRHQKHTDRREEIRVRVSPKSHHRKHSILEENHEHSAQDEMNKTSEETSRIVIVSSSTLGINCSHQVRESQLNLQEPATDNISYSLPVTTTQPFQGMEKIRKLEEETSNISISLECKVDNQINSPG